MWNVHALARREDGACDAQVVREADLLRAQSLADLRVELARLFVVDEERRALGVEHPCDLADQLLEQWPELELRGDLGHELQELQLLLARGFRLLDGAQALEGDGGLGDHGLEQLEVLPRELARGLVQELRDADLLAAQVEERSAEDALRREAGLAVDLRVEALVGVGVVDDGSRPRRVHVACHTDRVQHADLAADPSFRNACVELVRVSVVQEDRATLGADGGGRDVDQGVQRLAERARHRQPVGHLEQELGAAGVAFSPASHATLPALASGPRSSPAAERPRSGGGSPASAPPPRARGARPPARRAGR